MHYCQSVLSKCFWIDVELFLFIPPRDHLQIVTNIQRFSSKLQSFSKYPHCLRILLKRRSLDCFRKISDVSVVRQSEPLNHVREQNIFRYESSHRSLLKCFQNSKFEKLCSLLETCCNQVPGVECVLTSVYANYFNRGPMGPPAMINGGPPGPFDLSIGGPWAPP
jgi:hypothetical protein